MTCVIGLVHNGDTYLGADSASVSEQDVLIRSDKKVFRKGPLLIGFTSSFRMGQLLRYSLAIRKQKVTDDFRYMATDFVDALRTCFKAGGYATTADNAEVGGVFIVGYKGKLYQMDSDYQVVTIEDDFIAVGSGSQIAYGALYADRSDKNPRQRVLTALKAAERYNIGVRGPFTIIKSHV